MRIFFKKVLSQIIDSTIGKDRLFTALLSNNFLNKYFINIKFPEPTVEYKSQNILNQLKKIASNSKGYKSNSRKKRNLRILIFEPRGGFYGKIVLSLIAKRLKIHGIECLFVNCEELPICNGWSIVSPRPVGTCKTCLDNSNNLLKILNIPSKSINQLVDPSIRLNAKKIISNLSKNEIKQFCYCGFPLGKYINVSACSYLFSGSVYNNNESLMVMKKFLIGLIILYHAYTKILNDYKPDKAIITNGRFFWFKLAYEMCKKRNIQTISIDDFGSFGGTGNRWMFNHDVPIAELDLSTYWKDWADVEITNKEKKYLESMFIKGSPKNKVYYKSIELNWHKICLEIGINNNSEFDVMFTNLLWDSTCIDKNVCFENMLDWIFFTIDTYIKNKKILLIRIHPAEKGIFGFPSLQKVKDEIFKKYEKIPQNIKIIPHNSEISSYALLNRARLRIVYSSTLGLEVALRGIPVIVCGDVHYRKKGFTTDINSKEEYLKIIEGKSYIPNITEEQITLAYRYAFFFLYRTKIPLEFYKAKRFQIYKMTIKSFDEILPGRNKYLDLVIKGITNNTPIVLPRELSNKLYNLY